MSSLTSEELKGMDPWEITSNRFVAYFDILGFKNMVKELEQSEIHSILLRFGAFKKVVENMKGDLDVGIGTKIRASIFSDSIFFFTAGVDEESVSGILTLTRAIMDDCYQQGIPIKGAIASGNITVDIENNITFGRPIIDAFELQSDLLYYGVVVHNTAELEISKFEGLKSIGTIKYLTPFKFGKVSHYNIFWFGKKSEKEIRSYIKNFEDKYSGKYRIYSDNSLNMLLEMSGNFKKIKDGLGEKE